MAARVLLAAAAGAALAAALAARPGAAAGDPDAARTFGDRCASCHAVPDPALAADRVWIDQVRRTA